MSNEKEPDCRKKFLKDRFFAASWGASSGHNRVWNGQTETVKQTFRIALQNEAEEFLTHYTDKTPSDEQHIANIQALKDFSKEQGNELNIGTVQKLLNMLCKYYWCAGWIQEPPHLPIDKDMLGTIKSATAWTHLDSIDEYKELIAAFKEKSKAEGFNSLAQWELTVWNA